MGELKTGNSANIANAHNTIVSPHTLGSIVALKRLRCEKEATIDTTAN